MKHFERMKRQARATEGNGGTPYFRDRYNRVVEAGTELDLGPSLPGGAFVESIIPSMDPRHPAGAVRVRIVRPPIEVLVEGGKPIASWTIIRSTEEVLAAGIMSERPGGAEAEGPVESAGPADAALAETLEKHAGTVDTDLPAGPRLVTES